MYDPQTIQTIAVVVAIGFFVFLIFCLLYGVIQLAKIRRQAVGINQRLDELLARISMEPGSRGETGMSL